MEMLLLLRRRRRLLMLLMLWMRLLLLLVGMRIGIRIKLLLVRVWRRLRLLLLLHRRMMRWYLRSAMPLAILASHRSQIRHIDRSLTDSNQRLIDRMWITIGWQLAGQVRWNLLIDLTLTRRRHMMLLGMMCCRCCCVRAVGSVLRLLLMVDGVLMLHRRSNSGGMRMWMSVLMCVRMLMWMMTVDRLRSQGLLLLAQLLLLLSQLLLCLLLCMGMGLGHLGLCGGR